MMAARSRSTKKGFPRPMFRRSRFSFKTRQASRRRRRPWIVNLNAKASPCDLPRSRPTTKDGLPSTCRKKLFTPLNIRPAILTGESHLAGFKYQPPTKHGLFRQCAFPIKGRNLGANSSFHVEPTSPRSRELSHSLTNQRANDSASRPEKLAAARHFGALAVLDRSHHCSRRANA